MYILAYLTASTVGAELVAAASGVIAAANVVDICDGPTITELDFEGNSNDVAEVVVGETGILPSKVFPTDRGDATDKLFAAEVVVALEVALQKQYKLNEKTNMLVRNISAKFNRRRKCISLLNACKTC